ncbi:MAG TPA: FecR family protein [Flavitalea sp.]|nr:FecR family protein [Flavitalea sp.]
MNDRIKYLIENFWKNILTEDESSELNSLLEHGDYGFRNELEKQFQECIIQKQQQDLGPNEEGGRVIAFKWKAIWWAAAVIIAIAGIQLLNNENRVKPDTSIKGMATQKNVDTATLIQVKNNTASDLKVSLPDRSSASLSPNSFLVYKKYFDANERNVNLTGKAYFKVSKDHKRPFTVFANGLSTMALGTEFEVSTLLENKIVVKLFEGKVKVCPGDLAAGVFAPLYLTPGESVTYNIAKNSTEVGVFINKSSIGKIKKHKAKTGESSLIFDFKNEPLKNVFDKLSATSNIQIVYGEEHIKGLYFTGSILKSDSIRKMVKIISAMNGLTARDMDNHISISSQ